MTTIASLLDVRQDRSLIRPRWRSHRYVVVRVMAPPAPARAGRVRAPVNLAFALDRSGSMAQDKLRVAGQAVEEAISRLGAQDRFSLVVYDDMVDVVVSGTYATPDARQEAVGALRAIRPRGTTDLASGWLRGCEQVATALLGDGVNRCLLLTDGLANVGITERDELARHAAGLRARGVSTSTFGVGDDFDEVLLQSMADSGGGHFHDIADAAAIRDHITSEVGETLEVVARGVTLEVTVGEGVRVESISTFPVSETMGRAIVELGDLVAQQVVEVVLRLRFPYGQVGSAQPVLLSLADRDGAFAGTPTSARLTWEYASDKANDAQARDREVDRIVARLYAARARQRAVALNRTGTYREAREALESTARKIRGYAGSDPGLREIADALVVEADSFSRVMLERDRKQRYAASAYDLKSRMADGRAFRSPGGGGPAGR